MRNLSTSCLPPLLGALLAFPLGASTGAAPVKHAIGDTGVLRATLPNGLRVVIVRNPLAPVVTTQINYLVGSNEAPEGFPGSAHALEHMMFRGSKGLSREQLAQIAAAMGGDYNAQTTQTVTQYFYTAPASDLDVALRIEAIRMQGLELTKAGWDKERGAIEQEVSMDHSNPQYKFYSQLLAAMFKGTPYAHDALGTRASFDKTTAEALKQFHDQWYAPNNAILVIVGDVKPQAALAQVRKLFGRIPRKTLPTRPGITFSPVQPATLTLPTDLPVGIAALSYRMPSLTSKDYAAAQILSDVLGSQRGDLYALVPQGKALFAGFQFASFHKAGLGFAIAAFPKGGDAQAVLAEVQGVLAATLKQGVPAELVEAAKRNEIASLDFNRNSISGLAN
ncbi:MAG TPA: pitrilysin family protein, partial [Holophagaceae bacterium]